MVLRNLWRRGTRSLLTIIGIATGVAAVVALGAIANGIANGRRRSDLVAQPR